MGYRDYAQASALEQKEGRPRGAPRRQGLRDAFGGEQSGTRKREGKSTRTARRTCGTPGQTQGGDGGRHACKIGEELGRRKMKCKHTKGRQPMLAVGYYRDIDQRTI